MNALRHSRATEIEIEVQYLPRLLRLMVRDNGCGIDPEAVRKAGTRIGVFAGCVNGPITSEPNSACGAD